MSTRQWNGIETMQTRTKTLLLLLAGLSCITSVRAENLLDIYRLAKQNDPTYLAAVAEYNAAKESSPQAWAAVLPHIGLNANHSEYDQDVTAFGNTTSGRVLPAGARTLLLCPARW